MTRSPNLMNQGADWLSPSSTPSDPLVPATCNSFVSMVAAASASTVSSPLPLVGESSSPLGLALPTTTSAQTALLHQFLALRFRCVHCSFSAADVLSVHQHNLSAHQILDGAVFDSLNPAPQPDLLSAHSLLLQSTSTLLPVTLPSSLPSSPPLSASVHTVLPPRPQTDSALLQQQIQQHYDSLAPEGQVRCETCGKYLSKKKPLSSLINHAKRHYANKQFNCTECTYGSSEAAHVRNHMRLRHQVTDKEPVDLRDPRLQQAWMTIASKCFPSMTEQLSRFRFKRFRKRRRSSPSASASRSEQPSSTSAATSSGSADSRLRSLTESPTHPPRLSTESPPDTPSAFRVLAPRISESSEH
ncbi:hypothetical protein L596_015267 [Steinernema carpocapsae]|uniref:C2H2-type domain-containing protein n=1 Tax=Steinernema carpocapsae TaxID=34508 RepID=A0A4U5NFC9_STECR|nr:hypothetical protein L596_015267 [Steinernema carpocapsae]